MGGFLGIGGASWKTDRKTEMSGFSDLKNVFNFAMPMAQSLSKTGTDTTNAGVDAMGNSLNYWQKLLSGNRTATQQAMAPETNTALTQADAQKRQLASSGTARGGGVNATSQQTDTDTMAKVDNELFGARGAAADSSARVGGSLAATGQSEIGQAMNALGLGERAAGDRTELAMQSRAQSYKINQDMVGKVTNAIDQALMAAFA